MSISIDYTDQETLKRKAAEFHEKLGAILSVLDLDLSEISDSDKAALIWAALDYHELLGQTIGISPAK